MVRRTYLFGVILYCVAATMFSAPVFAVRDVVADSNDGFADYGASGFITQTGINGWWYYFKNWQDTDWTYCDYWDGGIQQWHGPYVHINSTTQSSSPGDSNFTKREWVADKAYPDLDYTFTYTKSNSIGLVELGYYDASTGTTTSLYGDWDAQDTTDPITGTISLDVGDAMYVAAASGTDDVDVHLTLTALTADISGPSGVPDSIVDLYDLFVVAENWLVGGERYDSIADFSGSMDPNGWSYYYKSWPDPNWFQCDYYDDANDVWHGPYVQVTAEGQSCDEYTAHFTKRVWTAHADGDLEIILNYDINDCGIFVEYTDDYYGYYDNDVNALNLKTIWGAISPENGTEHYSLRNVKAGSKIAIKLQSDGTPTSGTYDLQNSSLVIDLDSVVDFDSQDDFAGPDPLGRSPSGFYTPLGINGWKYYSKEWTGSAWMPCDFWDASEQAWHGPFAKITATTQSSSNYYTKREWTADKAYTDLNWSFTYTLVPLTGNLKLVVNQGGTESVLWDVWAPAEGEPTVNGSPTGTVSLAAGDTVCIQAAAGNGTDVPVLLTLLGAGASNFGAGDINGPEGTPDGMVNLYDFEKVAEEWQEGPVSYYIDSASGNDLSDGLTEATAWASLENLSSVSFGPGDSVRIKAGSDINVIGPGSNGVLTLNGSGTVVSPITMDIYGTGAKPIIRGSFVLFDQECWEFRNLEFDLSSTNPYIDTSSHYWAICFELSDFGVGHHYRFENLDIHDVSLDYNGAQGNGGILLISGYGEANDPTPIDTSFDDILIEGCTFERMKRRAIVISDYLWGAHGLTTKNTNVVIRNNTVSRTGLDGIVFISCEEALAEYNTVDKAHDNSLSPYDTGAAGLWCLSDVNSIIQYNEVSNTGYGRVSAWDSQGYDADTDCAGTIFQYNYSHNNRGGFMMFTNTDTATVRYNVSVNDGEDGGQLVQVSVFSGSPITRCNVYNNTFYVGSGQSRKLLGIYSPDGEIVNDVIFNNNIFYVGVTLTAGDSAGINNLVYDYNGYWGCSVFGGDAHAMTSNPLLVNPGTYSVDDYQLQTGSPAIAAGTVIADNGGQDFWGDPLPGTAPCIGADEK